MKVTHLIERWPEAVRTSLRFAPCCILVLLGYAMSQTFPDPDSLAFGEAGDTTVKWHAATETLVAVSGALTALLFGFLQLSSRSPFANRKIYNWLAMMGWNGKSGTSLLRPVLPLSEAILVLLLTAFCWSDTTFVWVLVPLAWVSARVIVLARFCLNTTKPEWLILLCLNGLAILMSNHLLSVPLTVALIAYAIWLEISALRVLSDQMLMEDLNFTSETDDRQSSIRFTNRFSGLHPFYDLRADLTDRRRSWKATLVLASITAWLTICVLIPIGRLGDSGIFQLHDNQSRPLPKDVLTIIAITIFATLAGLLRTIQHRPFSVWMPRLGPISRILSVRPVVWSYDRVFLPLLICIMLGGIPWLLPPGFELWKIVGAEILVIITCCRCGPATDEWQLTADASMIRSPLTSVQQNTSSIVTQTRSR
ncbi:MAG: hypothetical protein JNL58_24580 [Planctomyces sp.]|nr:hypothetical protein [Planctomyces sp.]